MNRKSSKLLKSLTLSAITVFTLPSLALTGTVTKVSGNRAIVQFDGPPQKGDTVTTGGDVMAADDASVGSSQAQNSKSSLAARKYALGYSMAASSVSEAVSGNGASYTSSSTNLGPFDASFSWIWGTFEFGPVLQYSNTTQAQLGTTQTSSALQLGGFFQYDFIQNKKGVTLVPGVFAKLMYNSISSGISITNGASTTTTKSGIGYGVGGMIDYLPFGDRFAFTGTLEYDASNLNVTQTNTPSGSDNLTGFFTLIGFKVYF